MTAFDLDRLGRTAARLFLDRFGPPPELAIVLGSGLADFVAGLDPIAEVAYADLDPALAPTVPGHLGRVVAGRLAGRVVWVFVGRRHFYEGVPFDQLVWPLAALAEAGCRRVLLTNAAGGIRADLRPGQWLAITDHLNLPGLAGQSPLFGQNDPPGGSRFLDLTDAYSPELRRLLRQVAVERGLDLAEGVYCFVAGPHYETPAETRFLAAIGADAVGMSTVPEVLAARRLGLRVAGLACIANAAAGSADAVSHAAVLATVAGAVPTLLALVAGLLVALPQTER